LSSVVYIFDLDSVSSLAANGQEADSRVLTLPEGVAPGQYYVFVGIDADNVIDELDNDNNGNVSALITVSGSEGQTVSISGQPEVQEGGTLTFSVTRSGTDLSQSLTVYYSTSGEAESGSDYEETTGFVTIASGESSVSINIRTIHDSVDEGSAGETLVLTLSTSSAYQIGTASTYGTIRMCRV
jgi:hypothetical protein